MKVINQLHAPAALLPGKESSVLLRRRLGGPQSRSGSGGEKKKKNFIALTGNWTPIVKPIA